MKRIKTRFPGVYQRTMESRRHAGRPDVCFDYSFKDREGRKHWVKAGLASEGITAQVANHLRSEALRRLRHGDALPSDKPPAPTFTEAADKYLEWASGLRSSASSQSRYDKWLKPRLGRKRLDEIRPMDLDNLSAAMLREGMAPKTVSIVLTLIGTIYNKAIGWELYDGENPVRKVRKPRNDNKRTGFLTPDEAYALIAELRRDNRRKKNPGELKDPALADMALFSLLTGARAGEIFNLRGSDVDFDNNLVSFYDTKTSLNRHIPMKPTVRDMMERRMPESPGAYIFTDRNGEKISEVSNRFDRAVEKLGLNDGIEDPRKRIVFHSLRHTFASWLAQRGVPILTIATLMGHTTIQMSMRYAHLAPGNQRDAIAQLPQPVVQIEGGNHGTE